MSILPTPKDSLIGLGRRHAPDPRDNRFLLRAPARTGRTYRLWGSPGVLDQGNTSHCVAYAGTKYLTSYPIKNKPFCAPQELYRLCQQNDEWPGEEPDYEGTSVRGLFKVLKARGYISEYRWAPDVTTIQNHVLEVGPVVMGTSWYRDMFMPDRWGYIQPTGVNDGGHAWLIIGCNVTRRNPDGSMGAFRMINSWGPGWGENGRAWLTYKAAEFLLNDDGEAGVATEILNAA